MCIRESEGGYREMMKEDKQGTYLIAQPACIKVCVRVCVCVCACARVRACVCVPSSA